MITSPNTPPTITPKENAPDTAEPLAPACPVPKNAADPRPEPHLHLHVALAHARR